jgi:hypothetical protein
MRIISLIVCVGLLLFASEAFSQTRATNQTMNSVAKSTEPVENVQTQVQPTRTITKMNAAATNTEPTKGSGAVRERKSVSVKSATKKVEDE